MSSPGTTPTLYLARRLAGQLGGSRREITRYEKRPDGRSFLAIAQSMYRDSGGHGSLVIIRPLDELSKTKPYGYLNPDIRSHPGDLSFHRVAGPGSYDSATSFGAAASVYAGGARR